MKKALMVCFLLLFFVVGCGGSTIRGSGSVDKNPEYGMTKIRQESATTIAPAKSWAKGKKVKVVADSGSIQLAGVVRIKKIESQLRRAGAKVQDIEPVDYKVTVIVQLAGHQNYSYYNNYNGYNSGVISVFVDVLDEKTKIIIADGDYSANVFYSHASDYYRVMVDVIKAAGYTAIYGRE
jgi:hypothetical protein